MSMGYTLSSGFLMLYVLTKEAYMLTIHAKGLGRYRIEDQQTGYVLNFLNPAAFMHHLGKVLRLNKKEQTLVINELTKSGKCKIERAKAA